MGDARSGNAVGAGPSARPAGLSLSAQQALWAYAFLAVPLAFYLGLRIAPAVSALVISLHRWNIISAAKPFVGLANFREIGADPLFWKAAVNTIRYAAVGIPAQLAAGLVLALLLQRIARFRGLFRAIYFAPFVTPIVAASWVWQWMYSPQFGPLNRVFDALGLPPQAFLRTPWEAPYAITAMVVWEYIGFQIVIFLAGLEAIPRVYYEAAEVDGASGVRLFRHITLPLLNPTLVFSAVYGTIIYLQLFTQVLNMTFNDPGGPLGSTETVVLYVYQQGFQHFRMGLAAAATVLLFAAILVITLLQLRVFSHEVEY